MTGREGGTSSKGSRALVSLGVSFLVVWGATEGPSVLTGEALWMMSREWGTEPWVRGERETECQAPAVFQGEDGDVLDQGGEWERQPHPGGILRREPTGLRWSEP